MNPERMEMIWSHLRIMNTEFETKPKREKNRMFCLIWHTIIDIEERFDDDYKMDRPTGMDTVEYHLSVFESNGYRPYK